MKVFLVNLDNVDYDCFEGFVVVAENEKEVWEHINKKYTLEKDQHATIEEVDPSKITKPTVILESFCAG